MRVLWYLVASVIRWVDWWLRPWRYPPGPRGPWAMINSVRAFRSTRYAAHYYAYIKAKYGKVVLVPAPMYQFFVYVFDAENHRTISMDWRKYPRADLQRMFESTVGTILGGEGEEQHRRRQLINPLLERKVLWQYVPTVQEEVLKMVKRWKSTQGKIKLAPELIQLLSEISARLLAGGVSLEKGFGLRVVQLIAEFQKNPVGKDYKDTKAYVFSKVEALLKEAQGQSMGILSTYALEVAEGRMTQASAVAEVVGFFNASVETTGNLLAWLIYYLASDPVRWQKAQSEVNQVFAGRSEIDPREMEKLDYLLQCAEEAGRLAPAAWRQLRKVASPAARLYIGGKEYHLPMHAQVFDFVNFIQTDADVWGSDAADFNPEKHMAPDFLASLPKGAYSPWSQGRHMCPGITKSKMDIVFILAHLLHEFRSVSFDQEQEHVLGPVLSFPHEAEMQLAS